MSPSILTPFHGISADSDFKPELKVTPARRRHLRSASLQWRSWILTPRQSADLELLSIGGLAPLRGFMDQRDVKSVCEDSRLADGTLWPIPITLDVDDETAIGISPGDPLVLRDREGVPLAILTVEDLWKIDRESFAEAIFGTSDPSHPGVGRLARQANHHCVSGPLEVLEPPIHYDFLDLRLTPAQTRLRFRELGWQKVVAFQTRNPLHRAHFEITRRAAEAAGAHLLIHPVVGPTREEDLDPFIRTRCYRAVLERYPPGTAMLALLPLAMRLAGPREAMLHAIIRKNYGCTHLIVGRDHAGPGLSSDGKPFYGPYEAQDSLRQHESELGVSMVPFQNLIYAQDTSGDGGRFVSAEKVPDGARACTLSGTELRRRLRRGDELPPWFTFPEVAAELRKSFPPRHQQGLTIFFSGLSGAGKSTLARILMNRLMELGNRPVTLLDGDLVRRNLSSELGFSKAHRDLNIQRIAFVAAEITKNRGIALCAPIAPYDLQRRQARTSIEKLGGFILVHVATPLEVCERRDRKGLYAKARAGLIEAFTGISDPYEEPTDAQLTLDSSNAAPVELVGEILDHLRRQGYLKDI